MEARCVICSSELDFFKYRIIWSRVWFCNEGRDQEWERKCRDRRRERFAVCRGWLGSFPAGGVVVGDGAVFAVAAAVVVLLLVMLVEAPFTVAEVEEQTTGINTTPSVVVVGAAGGTISGNPPLYKKAINSSKTLGS